MNPRSDNVGGAPPIRAFYSLGALAKIAGVHTGFLRRMLIAAGVVFVRNGRTAIVPLSEIERCAPGIWRCLVSMQAALMAAEKQNVNGKEANVARRAARVTRAKLV